MVNHAEKKHHPIAQALEADIEAKITHITTGGITESCDDPKGFNSPIFAVRKKNGKIRVQEGTQQSPHISRPMPNTNNRLHKISESKKILFVSRLP